MINSLNNSSFQRIAQIIKADKSSDKVIDELIIKYVDGEEVREKEIEFALAGHHYRYPKLIPENEVWIEDGLKDHGDVVATLVHEISERLVMKLLNIDYDDAHSEVANVVEKAVRKLI